ncbi:MarR family winged helix-turn-helix transcriptional regulator [uncultured Methanobrevibacter sp.]|uniref:MarR family winged helix-turn-helix transcriptional regulator n=1 Tax=uncultured Methanobrevibacter sp. TaxID=253161 RepID=UPI0025EED1F8|nr:MarR family transcriptional regulator [uncultured Methanobrevibacter sp.]
MDLNSNKKTSDKGKKKQPMISDIYSLDNNEIDNVPIGFFFGPAASQYLTFFGRYLKDLDITQNQFWILLTLFQEKNISQERIASILKLNEATVTREINTLEKRNLIMRKTDENDRRRKIVSPSDGGLEMYKMVKEVDYKSQAEVLKYFSKEELHILKFLLKKLMITMKEILEE